MFRMDDTKVYVTYELEMFVWFMLLLNLGCLYGLCYILCDRFGFCLNCLLLIFDGGL